MIGTFHVANFDSFIYANSSHFVVAVIIRIINNFVIIEDSKKYTHKAV